MAEKKTTCDFESALDALMHPDKLGVGDENSPPTGHAAGKGDCTDGDVTIVGVKPSACNNIADREPLLEVPNIPKEADIEEMEGKRRLPNLTKEVNQELCWDLLTLISTRNAHLPMPTGESDPKWEEVFYLFYDPVKGPARGYSPPQAPTKIRNWREANLKRVRVLAAKYDAKAGKGAEKDATGCEVLAKTLNEARLSAQAAKKDETQEERNKAAARKATNESCESELGLTPPAPFNGGKHSTWSHDVEPTIVTTVGRLDGSASGDSRSRDFVMNLEDAQKGAESLFSNLSSGMAFGSPELQASKKRKLDVETLRELYMLKSDVEKSGKKDERLSAFYGAMSEEVFSSLGKKPAESNATTKPSTK